MVFCCCRCCMLALDERTCAIFVCASVYLYNSNNVLQRITFTHRVYSFGGTEVLAASFGGSDDDDAGWKWMPKMAWTRSRKMKDCAVQRMSCNTKIETYNLQSIYYVTHGPYGRSHGICRVVVGLQGWNVHRSLTTKRASSASRPIAYVPCMC